MKKTLLALFTAAVATMAYAADVADVAKKTMEKVTPNTITFKGQDGWLYSKNELAHLSAGELAGGKIVEHSKSSKKDNANPIPAMEAFNNELKELGVKLIVVPIPPKCAVVPFEGLKQGEAMMYLKPFYEELRAKGIEVLDLYVYNITIASRGTTLYSFATAIGILKTIVSVTLLFSANFISKKLRGESIV